MQVHKETRRNHSQFNVFIPNRLHCGRLGRSNVSYHSRLLPLTQELELWARLNMFLIDDPQATVRTAIMGSYQVM